MAAFSPTLISRSLPHISARPPRPTRAPPHRRFLSFPSENARQSHRHGRAGPRLAPPIRRSTAPGLLRGGRRGRRAPPRREGSRCRHGGRRAGCRVGAGDLASSSVAAAARGLGPGGLRRGGGGLWGRGRRGGARGGEAQVPLPRCVPLFLISRTAAPMHCIIRKSFYNLINSCASSPSFWLGFCKGSFRLEFCEPSFCLEFCEERETIFVWIGHWTNSALPPIICRANILAICCPQS